MMALLIFLILSLAASILVIFAAALSARISRREDWTENYDSSEATAGQAPPLHKPISPVCES